MVKKDNPAGRLYTILRDVERQNESAETRKAWATVFGVPENSEFEILRGLIDMQQLVDETEKLISNNDQLNSALFLKSFGQLRRAVSARNLANPWKTYKAGLTVEAMTRLEFCAEVLSTTHQEDLLTSEEIEQLREALEEIAKFTEEIDIDYELKVFVLSKLELIRRGIFDYKINGASALRGVIETIIGSTVTEEKKYHDIKETHPDVLERLGELLDKIDSMMSKALKVQRVLSRASRVLGLPWGKVDGDSERTET
jgi:hypothetical protein